MTPLQRYQSDIDKNRIIPDPAQSAAVEYTQSLYDELVAANRAAGNNPLGRFFRRFRARRAEPVTGLYLWGSVGSGKTHIVDAFFDCLPFHNKLRVHFHRYMQWVHAELKRTGSARDPLRLVANKLAKDIRVLCFDEFHVADITDAMLLSGLFDALFAGGVTLVATSNEPPGRLYWDGLQRERFLPAIKLIRRHTRVLRLETGMDYRLRYLDQAKIYHHPLGAEARRKLLENFANIAPETGTVNSTLEIEDREIRAVRLAADVVWFDFSELCAAPRGAADYIEIARQFQTVFLENVPQMDDMDNDRARRFIVMVDEYYDRNVKLVISAQVEAKALYTGKRLAAEFERTGSRLIEMQSHDYLKKARLPA